MPAYSHVFGQINAEQARKAVVLYQAVRKARKCIVNTVKYFYEGSVNSYEFEIGDASELPT